MTKVHDHKRPPLEEVFRLTPEMQAQLTQDTTDGPEVYAPKPKPAAALIADRGSTHGDFRTNAILSQQLKLTFRSYDGWDHLDAVERECLDMIALKISRVLSGRSLERQHWEDIEGYAHLALRECK